MTNKKLPIKVGQTYLLESLRDEVVCTYVTPEQNHLPGTERVAVFVFKSKVAAFHCIPFTLPLAMCDQYLAEIPQPAQA